MTQSQCWGLRIMAQLLKAGSLGWNERAKATTLNQSIHSFTYSSNTANSLMLNKYCLSVWGIVLGAGVTAGTNGQSNSGGEDELLKYNKVLWSVLIQDKRSGEK